MRGVIHEFWLTLFSIPAQPSRFALFSRGVPLTILPSPYRSLVDPVVEHIKHVQHQEPCSLITVVIPEFVPKGWFARLLHGQAGLLLALRLHEMEGVVVINVPYHIKAFVPLPPEKDNPSAGRQSTGRQSANGHRKGTQVTVGHK